MAILPEIFASADVTPLEGGGELVAVVLLGGGGGDQGSKKSFTTPDAKQDSGATEK